MRFYSSRSPRQKTNENTQVARVVAGVLFRGIERVVGREVEGVPSARRRLDVVVARFVLLRDGDAIDERAVEHYGEGRMLRDDLDRHAELQAEDGRAGGRRKERHG